MGKKKNTTMLFFAALPDHEQQEEETSDDQELTYEIPIFREGAFEHYWYGDLNFTKELLDELVKNHNANVYPSQVAFDASHRPGDGALAWVEPNGLSVKPIQLSDGRVVNVVYAKITYTPEGYEQVIQKKKYKYFSAEIDNNFTTNEVFKNEDGSTGVRYYGPTLIGGGFTNRPFIPNLPTVFSSDGQPVLNETEQIYCLSTKKEDFPDTANLGTFIGLIHGSIDEQEQQPAVEPNKGEEMKFLELMAKYKAMQFSTPAEGVAFLRTALAELSPEEKGMAEEFIQLKESSLQFSNQAEEFSRQRDALKSEIESSRLQLAQMTQAVADAKQQAFSARVNAFTEQLANDNIPPVVVNKVDSVLKGLNAESRNQKFSIDGQERPVDALELLSQIFSVFPNSMKVATEGAAITNQDQVDEHPLEAIASEQAVEEEPKLEDRFQLFFKEVPTLERRSSF